MIEIGPNLMHAIEGAGSFLMFIFLWYMLLRGD